MKLEYNIAFIDTEDASVVLEILNSWGQNGWRFVSWLELSKKNEKLPYLKFGIFEKVIEEE